MTDSMATETRDTAQVVFDIAAEAMVPQPDACVKCGKPVQRTTAWRVPLNADGLCPDCAWMEGGE